MESRRQGLNNAVKSILRNKSENSKFDYIQELLADIVAADVKYAAAVEAALEGRTDALTVNSLTDLLADIETISNLDGVPTAEPLSNE